MRHLNQSCRAEKLPDIDITSTSLLMDIRPVPSLSKTCRVGPTWSQQLMRLSKTDIVGSERFPLPTMRLDRLDLGARGPNSEIFEQLLRLIGGEPL